MTSSSLKGFYKQQKKGGKIPNKPSSISKKSTTTSFAKRSGSDDLHNNVEEEKMRSVLEQFDVDMRFGPCIGLTRMERWERASTMGLNPPSQVRSILLDSNNSSFVDSLWEDRV